MEETYKQQMKDSDMIFKQVTSANFSKEEAKRVIVMLYVPDMSISRAGISHALKRIEQHYGIEEAEKLVEAKEATEPPGDVGWSK